MSKSPRRVRRRTGRPVVSYPELRGEGDLHPYLSARAGRIDASVRRQGLLRVLAVGSAALSVALLVAVVALLRMGGDPELVPYLVQVDGDGAVVEVDALTRGSAAVEPTEAMVRHALGLFVVNSRTVTTDRVAQRRLILRAYDYASGRAVGVLNDHYRSTPPFSRAARTTVTPTLTSLLYLSERDVYEVLWTEAVRNLNGALVERQTWRALLTVTIDPPEAVEDALANPLGIKVADLDWTRLTPTDS
jgi:type IV secretion system protein TrbF